MTKINTIFFDIDNTLLNYSASHNEVITIINSLYFPQVNDEMFSNVWKEKTEAYWLLYERKELTYSEQRFKRITSVWKYFGEDITSEQVNNISSQYQDFFEKSWKAFPEVIETLKKIQQQNVQIGVLTNGNSKQQRHKLKTIDIHRYINPNLFIISEEVGYTKPAKEIYEYAAQQANVPVKHIMIIGDNPLYDIEPARKAGWNAILIDYFGKYPNLKSIKKLSEIDFVK